jgi:hypothetical protein
MNDDQVMLSRDACRAVMDAVECAIVDRRASRATRRAALSALLSLIDAGLVVGAAPEPNATGTAAAAGVRAGIRLAAG